MREGHDESLNYIKYVDAILFASNRYDGRMRKGMKTHRIVHALRVAEILRNDGGIRDWTILIAAVLHDLMEDTATTYEDIADHFGPQVASIVAELSDDKRLPRKKRKKQLLSRVGQLSLEAKTIKLGDRLDNVRDEWLAADPSPEAERIRSYYFIETTKILESIRGTNQKLEDCLRRHLRDLES